MARGGRASVVDAVFAGRGAHKAAATGPFVRVLAPWGGIADGAVDANDPTVRYRKLEWLDPQSGEWHRNVDPMNQEEILYNEPTDPGDPGYKPDAVTFEVTDSRGRPWLYRAEQLWKWVLKKPELPETREEIPWADWVLLRNMYSHPYDAEERSRIRHLEHHHWLGQDKPGRLPAGAMDAHNAAWWTDDDEWAPRRGLFAPASLNPEDYQERIRAGRALARANEQEAFRGRDRHAAIPGSSGTDDLPRFPPTPPSPDGPPILPRRIAATRSPSRSPEGSPRSPALRSPAGSPVAPGAPPRAPPLRRSAAFTNDPDYRPWWHETGPSSTWAGEL